MIPMSFWCLILLLLMTRAIASEAPRTFHPKMPNSNEEEKRTNKPSDVPHSRQKRLIWITDDGRLALPPGTSLIIAPTLGNSPIKFTEPLTELSLNNNSLF